MRIHIFGASGSGVTTLGLRLAQQLQYPYFDNDDFFWEKSDPPFTVRRAPHLRNQLLKDNLSLTDGNYIVGGSMVSWGDEWLLAFDLAVFLYVPPQVRLDRLKKREYERYGDVIYKNPERHQQYLDFIAWAASYDDPASTRRSLGVHLNWMSKLKCELIRIDGVTSVEYRTKLVLAAVDNYPR
ncbi:adenylate kinase [Mucilaginibacter sp. PPCGB 2223]|uniref:AAA family ATPase n=1 Tax=Mucilaginibacter sp. PPCGB 2223 TaxID=1886027 RepID=UPI000824DE0C|nr:AAA family ATPase [Mucilaginibacter sp. PPCGB 2223]OCX52379.1 adenylate kinase [Mucilaginibacter sp. PPCGB 2223]